MAAALCAQARPFAVAKQHNSASSRQRGSLAVRCVAQRDSSSPLVAAARKAGGAVAAAAAAAVLLVGPGCGPASADLNKFESAINGEFGTGTALQFGEADVKGQDFSKQNLQRSNFTAADCRDCNFKDSNLSAAYFMKSVLARANMEGADLSDALMDRSVIVNANLKNAILQRAVLTRSDLKDADIYGADFTNALLDKTQQMALCKYADGVNPVTGVSTRKSLACGSSRRFKASSPSDPEGPQVSQAEKDAFTKTLPTYRQ